MRTREDEISYSEHIFPIITQGKLGDVAKNRETSLELNRKQGEKYVFYP